MTTLNLTGISVTLKPTCNNWLIMSHCLDFHQQQNQILILLKVNYSYYMTHIILSFNNVYFIDAEELRGEMRTLAMQGLTQSAFRKSTTEVYDNFTQKSKQTNTCYDNLAEGNSNLTPPLYQKLYFS